MMLAQIENFPMPAQFASWIACAAFLLWLFLLVKKAMREVRGEEPQPPNSHLNISIKEIRRRIEALEDWRSELMTKLDEDKTEILQAGERREEKITDRVNDVLIAVSTLEGKFDQFNQDRR
jgi:hypothetical protein